MDNDDDDNDYDDDDVNNNDEVKKDAIITRTDDILKTQVHASRGRRTNQSLHYKPAATAAANSNARVMRLRGSYLRDHDMTHLNAHSATASTNIPRLDEFSDDSFEYPETSGENIDYDDGNDQECDDTTRDNNSTPLSSSKLIVTTKNKTMTKWIDEDYPAITWITPSGDTVVEMLIRRSQRMALLLLVATIFVAMLSIGTLRYTITTPPFRSTNNMSLVVKMKEIPTAPSVISTLSPKQSNGTPEIVLDEVDACPKTTTDQARRETSLSIWTATKKVFSTNVRVASDEQRSLSSIQLPRQSVHEKAKQSKPNKRTSVALVPSTPSTHDTRQTNQLVSFEDMHTIRWGMVPAMLARSSFSSMDTSSLADPSSTATTTSVRQRTARTTSGPSVSSVSHPSDMDTLPLENQQRKIPPLLRRLLLLFAKDHSTTKSHLDAMETIQIPRSLAGTIPLYVAQLSSLQMSRTQMHDVVPRSTTIATTTITTVSLLDLLAARIIVAQKRIAEWLKGDRDSTTRTPTSIVVDSRIEMDNPGLWGTIPSNLGHSSLLVGLLDNHYTVVEQFFQESSQERDGRRKEAPLSAGEEEEEECSIRTGCSKLGTEHVFLHDLAMIQSWMMTPASGLAGTISKIGPSAVQIGMYLQK
ncbi:hypothetical protein MHU86_5814 [Fragilaria crotonensis]|nr:hypothetical protein MHU86_5814 [Fragilaria crotonensis]